MASFFFPSWIENNPSAEADSQGAGNMPIDHASHDELERSVAEVDLEAYVASHAPYHPSPDYWQDQILYFLMLDRFSDGNESGTVAEAGGAVRDAFRDNDGARVVGGSTPPFDFAHDAYKADRAAWAAAGGEWCGGTLKGLHGKLGYLRRLGVTAVWISPVFKQVRRTFDLATAAPVPTNSYHGYGIQNFFDVDPALGTRQDLKALVAEAHRLGIYVILDIILNHTGDVFQYDADRYPFAKDNTPLGENPQGQAIMDPRWDGRRYRVLNYRDPGGAATLPFGSLDINAHANAWPDGAVWPAELQEPRTFSRVGRITDWDHNEAEYLNGDFESLKDVDQGYHDLNSEGQKEIGRFHPSSAFMQLCNVYKFWIAFADIDGYRVDTVKHMELGATRLFASAIHEFAQRVGKERFFLLGEITGGRARAFDTLKLTGLDAALGIDDVADKLEYLPKGYRDAEAYFNLFRNSWEVGQDSHVWLGAHLATMFDDHDKVGRVKRRFAGDKVNRGYEFLIPALALNLTTLGIPCIYYGTEQGFDGDGDNDRFLRECMFGGPFGSLQSWGRHFFDEQHPVFQAVAAIADLLKRRIELRRGRQYLREISADGSGFGYPHRIGGQMRAVVPWSRLFDDRELVLAINTDADNSHTAWVTIDDSLHRVGDRLTCIFATDSALVGQIANVEARNGKAVRITVPAAGFIVYE
jgi:glycosidase